MNYRGPLLILLLVCLITPGWSQPSSATYPNTNDGLTKFLEAVLAAARSGDERAVMAFVHDMDIPNYDAWFRSNYSAAKAEVWSAHYAREKEKNDQALLQTLQLFARVEGDVSVLALDSHTIREGNPIWDFYHSDKGPVDLYRATFRANPPGRGGAIGYFIFIDDGFRWLSLISPQAGAVFRVGGGVSAPRPLVTPDPSYTKEAQKAKLQGKVVLWLIVDAEGNPRDIKVARSLDPGLDKKAAEAVSQWKFEPAMKDGHPVAVQINVQVNFKLY